MEQMSEQAKLWNGTAGQAWVDAQALLDGMFKPFEEMLAALVQPGRRVLDIGCGTGAVTLVAARKSGVECIGVDVSEPMLALARRRADDEQLPVSFVCADAQTHTFESQRIDMILSRFGVMFFENPVNAFANLHQAADTNAELYCYSWRSPTENPFMTTAERAAKLMLPAMPARLPDAPGQFAFADAGRVELILAKGGWRDISLQAVDVPCVFPQAGLYTYFTRLGPLGLMLQQADDAMKAQIIATVRAAFEPYVFGDEVRFTAACWEMHARA